MKLLFTGASHCPHLTFMRLLLIAEEIAFLDRPGVTFGLGDGQWGLVGADSPVRRLVPAFAETQSPVRLTVHDAPFQGLVTDFLKGCIEADLQSLRFREIFLSGLRENNLFARKFLSPGNYGNGLTEADIRAALVGDKALASAAIDTTRCERPGMLFQISDSASRRDSLRVLLAEASVSITSALLVAGEGEFVPTTDDPFVARLLALRASDPSYVGTKPSVAPFLAFEIAKAVIPDQALEKMTPGQVIRYRKKASEPYEAWNVELRRLASGLDGASVSDLEKDFQKIIDAEVGPQLLKYKSEMTRIRDELFGDVIKAVTTWQLPTLTVAYLASLSFSTALAACGGMLTPAIPGIVDYINGRRAVKRENALAYLISASPEKARS